jgi:acylphosphatase
MKKARAHVLISGRVQGVSFRYYTMEEARRRNLTGWVRNLWDGRVEAVFEGEPDQVEAMLAWCGHGPGSASVSDVKVTQGAPTGEFENFRIRINASARE